MLVDVPFASTRYAYHLLLLSVRGWRADGAWQGREQYGRERGVATNKGTHAFVIRWFIQHLIGPPESSMVKILNN